MTDVDPVSPVAALANRLSAALRASPRQPSPPTFSLPPSQVAAYVHHVLTFPEWLEDASHTVDLLSLAIAPMSWPSSGLSALRDAAGAAARSGVCGKVWKQDELAYKCKTCERDPTCVVCVQCFRNGDHTGHDYAMIRTSGGCCDCGDVQAWRPEGFCRNHKGACAEDDDPGASLPPHLKESLKALVRVVAAHVAHVCYSVRTPISDFFAPEPNHVCTKRAAALIDWIQEIVQVGDGIRRVVGLILVDKIMTWSECPRNEGSPLLAGKDTKPSDRHRWLTIMLEVDGAERLPVNLQNSLHALYFQLITDLVFKRAFLERIVDNYERYTHAQVWRKLRKQSSPIVSESHQNVPDLVEDFSVQLFTVPALVPVMIRRGGLLDILIGLLLNLFEASAVPVSPYVKGIELSKSAYANEYETRTSRTGHAAASSSTSPRSSRRFSLPIPFDCADVSSEEPANKKRGVSQRAVRASDSSGVGGSQAVEVDIPQDESSEASSPMEVEQVSDHSADFSLGLEEQNSHDEEELMASEAESAEHDGEEESEEDDTMDTEDGAGLDIINDVLEAAGHAIITLDDVDGPDQADANGETGTIPATEDGPAMARRAAEDLLDEFGDEESQNMRDNGLNLREQMAVFEEGLHFLPSPKESLSSSEAEQSSLLSAVREARKSQNAAESGTGPLAHTMRLAWSHGQDKICDWVCWRIVNDLKYVLTHREVAFHLLHVRQDLFRRFVRIMSIAQGMNGVARRFKDHVPVEADTWAESFTIEIEFYYYVEFLAVAFCAAEAPKSGTGSNGLSEEACEIDLRASRLRCIDIVRTCLDEWLDREEALEARSTFSGEEFTVAHSVSVHLPLHRFLAFMVHHVLRLDGVSLPVAISGGNTSRASVEDARRLLRHPLRVQAFLAQVRAGMWKRNGHAVTGQSLFYRSILCSEWFVDLDLFLQQCCAVVLGPQLFVQEVQHTFRIESFRKVSRLPGTRPSDGTIVNRENSNSTSEMNNDEHDRNSRGAPSIMSEGQTATQSKSVRSLGFLPLAPRRYAERGVFNHPTIEDAGNTRDELAGFAPTLIEDLLVHITRVASERSRCGAGEADFLRRKLLHQLCARDRTHSQLYRACSYRICHELSTINDAEGAAGKSDSLVEATLAAIADYVEPKGMEQGRYKLKDDLWREFDPFTPHMIPREKCAAEVRHATVCRRQKRKIEVISSDIISERKVIPQMRGLLDLCRCVSQVDALGTEMLRRSLPECGGPSGVEGAVAAALHLVCAAVETGRAACTKESPYWLNGCLQNGSFSDTAPGLICEMYKLASKPGETLFMEFIPVFERILVQASRRGNEVLSQFLARAVPLEALQKSSGTKEGQVYDDTSLSPEQVRRKALLKKKKEQQAAAMARMRKAQASFAKHIDTSGGNPSLVSEDTHAVTDTQTDGQTDDVSPALNKQETTEFDKKPSGPSTEAVTKNVEECALCHELGSSEGAQFIGLIGFHQRTRLPGIARDQCRKFAASCDKRNPLGAMSPTDMAQQSARAHAGPVRDTDRVPASQAVVTVREDTKANTGTGDTDDSFLNPEMLESGLESSTNLHLSFCGHALHVHCFDRYFTSLLQSRANQTVFEGYSLINLDRLEFLCPVCRRLANIVLPLMCDADSDCPDESTGGGLPNTAQSHGDWVKRCNREITKGFSNEGAHLLARAKSSDVKNSSQDNRDVPEPQGSAPLEVFLSRGRAVLQRFGLQGSPISWTSSEAQTDGEAQSPAAFGPYFKLPSAAISTIACAEIAARAEVWGGSSSQLTQKHIGVMLKEARSQIRLEPGLHRKGLVRLWGEATAPQHEARGDPFLTFAYLFLLWPEELNVREAQGIARLCFDLIQAELEVGPSGVNVIHANYALRVLQFLRRVTVMVSSYFKSGRTPPLTVYEADGRVPRREDVGKEVDCLMKYFGIPAPQNRAHLLDLRGSGPITVLPGSIDFMPKRIGLIHLPRLFQELLEELDGKMCTSCGKPPKGPTICLVCRALLCSSASKKSSTCKSGSLLAHAEECGAGIGVFLVLKTTSVQIIRKERSTVWGSPYLDAHGEEDKKFSRGKPLFLNEERYAFLRHLWITHGFDQDSRILNSTMPTRFVQQDH